MANFFDPSIGGRRRNPDEDLRALERKAASGDHASVQRYRAELARRGLTPKVDPRSMKRAHAMVRGRRPGRDFVRRYSGDVVVILTALDDGSYKGVVRWPRGEWKFSGLRNSPHDEGRFAIDSAEAYDSAARGALGFGSYENEEIYAYAQEVDPERGTGEFRVRRAPPRQNPRGQRKPKIVNITCPTPKEYRDFIQFASQWPQHYGSARPEGGWILPSNTYRFDELLATCRGKIEPWRPEWDKKPNPRRSNSDEERRRLERLASQGDRSAAHRLRQLKLRSQKDQRPRRTRVIGRMLGAYGAGRGISQAQAEALRRLFAYAEKRPGGRVGHSGRGFTRVDKVMQMANRILEGHGLEVIHSQDGEIVAEYVNMGDPYVATVLYEYDTGRFKVTGWGDWVEKQERRRGETFRNPLAVLPTLASGAIWGAGYHAVTRAHEAVRSKRRNPLGKTHQKCKHECYCQADRRGFFMPCFACQACEQARVEARHKAPKRKRNFFDPTVIAEGIAAGIGVGVAGELTRKALRHANPLTGVEAHDELVHGLQNLREAERTASPTRAAYRAGKAKARGQVVGLHGPTAFAQASRELVQRARGVAKAAGRVRGEEVGSGSKSNPFDAASMAAGAVGGLILGSSTGRRAIGSGVDVGTAYVERHAKKVRGTEVKANPAFTFLNTNQAEAFAWALRSQGYLAYVKLFTDGSAEVDTNAPRKATEPVLRRITSKANPIATAPLMLVGNRKRKNPGPLVPLMMVGNRPRGQVKRRRNYAPASGRQFELRLPADRVLGTMSLADARRRWGGKGQVPFCESAFRDFHKIDPNDEVVILDDGKKEWSFAWTAGESPEVTYSGGADKVPDGSVKGDAVYVHQTNENDRTGKPNKVSKPTYLIGLAPKDGDPRHPVTRDFMLFGHMTAQRGWLRR